jgi:hypothetical protein
MAIERTFSILKPDVTRRKPQVAPSATCSPNRSKPIQSTVPTASKTPKPKSPISSNQKKLLADF